MLTSSNILVKRLIEIKDFIRQARVDMALERMGSVLKDFIPIEGEDSFRIFLDPFYRKWDKKITLLTFQYNKMEQEFVKNEITSQERNVRMNQLIANLLSEQEILFEELYYRISEPAVA